MVSNGRLSPIAHNAASIGKATAKNFMVPENVEGYASLLESILELPSEVAVPQAAKNIPTKLKAEWQWHLFEAIADTNSNKTSTNFLGKVEKQFNRTSGENSMDLTGPNDTFLYTIWEEQKFIDMVNTRKRKEDEEVSEFSIFLVSFYNI